MKTAIAFNQVLALVKQLPQQEKLLLTKELEKEGIEFKLTALLKTFQTEELSLDTISGEIEIIRQQLYINNTIL